MEESNNESSIKIIRIISSELKTSFNNIGTISNNVFTSNQKSQSKYIDLYRVLVYRNSLKIVRFDGSISNNFFNYFYFTKLLEKVEHSSRPRKYLKNNSSISLITSDVHINLIFLTKCSFSSIKILRFDYKQNLSIRVLKDVRDYIDGELVI